MSGDPAEMTRPAPSAGLAWYLARRYLASRKKGRLLSFITWIALGGVTIGVTALIVVLGVMNGMQEELREKILGSTPHIMVLEPGVSLRMGGWEPLMESLGELPEVEAVAPFILTKTAILRESGGEQWAQSADLYGVSLDLDPADAPTEIEQDIRRGVYALDETESGLPPVILGSRLAQRMGIFQGDTLAVVSLENIRTNVFGATQPKLQAFEVTGTFTTGMYEYDINNMYAPLPAVQELLDIRADNQVSGLSARITDPWNATAVAGRAREHIGPPYFVDTWITQNQALFSALQLEKIALGVILFLIVIVAAFNIVSTLVMVVVERTSEIGILKSMGMTDAQILRVFLFQGMAIGFLGTAFGTTLGLLISWIVDRFEVIQIPADVYFLDHLPVSTNPLDVGFIVVGSMLIALVATIYPALQASRLQPVEAIKHD